MQDIKLTLKVLTMDMDNMSIRQIEKKLVDIKKMILEYRYSYNSDDINDYTDYSLYKLQGLFEIDILDMSYKQICDHIKKILNIVEFLED